MGCPLGLCPAPTTGLTHRIEDIVDGRLDVSVVAAAKDNSLHIRPVVSWFDQGLQQVLGLRTEGGNTLRVTPDHKVLFVYSNLDPSQHVQQTMDALKSWRSSHPQ